MRVERDDGRLHQARFAFATPPEPPSSTSFLLTDRPAGVHDVVASPGEVVPAEIAVEAGATTRVALMYVDEPGCGPFVWLEESGATAEVTPDGLAELAFVPATTGTLSLTCTAWGLLLRR